MNSASPVTPQSITSASQLTQVISRPVFVFEVPKTIATASNIKTVGLVELTADEELFATKRSSNNPIKLAYELAKESLRLVDSATVSTADGSADLVWNRMPAALRTLIISGYQDIHNPKEDDLSSFMKSRSVKVG